MEKIRCNTSVFVRGTVDQRRDLPEKDAKAPDSAFDWEERRFESISQAKKFNGPDSRTISHPRELPPKTERE